MTKNWEVFDRDPRSWNIPNQGVTKLGRPEDDGDWEVLRWELESFVCEGEYSDGLERILSSYLGNLARAEQAAVWVSGFYGSGKSHLVRLLATLWADDPLPDGSTPRGLAQLSQGVRDQLVELSNAGKRSSGLWAAAGKLGSGVRESYRLAFLSVLFSSAGLPEQYPAARLAMKLQGEGVYEVVVAALKDQGKVPAVEFLSMYASPVLGQAVVDALPDFASDQHEARELFKLQYPPQQTDISNAETITVMQELLGLVSDKPGEIPCTVVVLDELQQYIGDDNDKLGNVVDITELCATNFDSKVMVVGTGQSALQGSPMLSKIQDRFYLRVELSDRDVEQVTRQLVLRKKPEMQAEVKATLDSHSGEIDKHLVPTKIGARPADSPELVPDYPLLPVRRRFWERALRAIDAGGGTGQLRTQLRVTHDANQHVADRGLGSVVGGDFIFANQIHGMLSSRVLSQDMYHQIKGYETEEGDETLKSRILGLVFLISRLPRDPGADIGVRARPEMLAELLVSDLGVGSSELKNDVQAALVELEQDGVIAKVDEEYRMQTPEGAELQRLFKERFGLIKNDAMRILEERDRALRSAVENVVAGLRVNHGQANVPRRADVEFGSNAPDTTGKDIPVWVQDEWTISAKEVRSAAQRADTSDPTIFVLLPRLHSDRLRDAIAGHNAARHVLDTTAISDTAEGREARAALQGRLYTFETQIDQVVGEVLSGATVWQAGGNDVAEGTLQASVNKAIEAALVRKFPKFKDADHKQWGLVLNRAREGNQNPLDAVGYNGNVEDHPVCKAILSFLSTGKKGNEVRAHFEAGEYGWPQDAVNGALLTLVAADIVEATDKAGKKTSVKDIRVSDINSTNFKPLSPGERLSTKERITARKLAQDLGVHVDTGQEVEGVASALQKLIDRADRAGGEPPLPEKPNTSLVKQLQSQPGNGRVKSFLAEADKLRSLFEETAKAELVPERLEQWDRLVRLRQHADGLKVVDEVEASMGAVIEQRQLLESPDPAQPLMAKLSDHLRSRIQEAHKECEAAVVKAIASVRAMPEWEQVGEDAAQQVLGQVRLVKPKLPPLGSPSEVLAALDATSLESWKTRTDAVDALIGRTQENLAKLAEPAVEVKHVSMPNRVLKNAEDVESYIDEVRSLLHSQLDENTHLSI